ncbi:bifunctional oligoribonuclease/PAP phosphatase NrnA [bacterium]|nr:bifunctional oligoribonuclease/PAP phosphatase NrnA [bacterium]
MLSWQKLDELIHASQRVLLTTHVRPDGDALGSELGLAELIAARGKSVEILNSSPTPTRYRFLDPDGSLFGCIDSADPVPLSDPDLFIVVDTGTWSQLAGLAPYVRTIKYPKVVIDHHVSQDDLGAVRLVDTSAAASGMLVFQAYEALGLEISPRAAQALFIAIAMDTGWMRHPNCSSDVFRAQAKLMECGAKPHEIYRLLFEQNRVERLRMMGLLFERIERFGNGKLATSYLSWDDIMKLGAHPMETEDFINELMTLASVEVAILFIGQADGGTKASFRSRSSFDCSHFAEQFGGGGHRAAAGASLSIDVDQARKRIVPMALAMVTPA